MYGKFGACKGDVGRIVYDRSRVRARHPVVHMS